MAAINFPASPTNNQTFTSGDKTWIYSTTVSAWKLQSQTLTGPVGPAGVGALNYLGHNNYTSTTAITPSTVSPNARMAMITVVGPGAGGSSIGNTSASSWAIGQGGGSGGAITALVFNSTYYSTYASAFSYPWDIVVGAGGVGGPIGFGTGSADASAVVGNPLGAKVADWGIIAYGGSGANYTGAATSIPVRNIAGQGNTVNTGVTVGALFIPPIYSYQRKTTAGYSYVTGLTLGYQEQSVCPMSGLITPYLPNQNNNGGVVIVSTGILSGQSDGFGAGGRALVRTGTGSATAGLAGSGGLVHISWWG
jgi:hypothetical protein